eukprot:4516420-Pleurochrysis_carterae.AAC.2
MLVPESRLSLNEVRLGGEFLVFEILPEEGAARDEAEDDDELASSLATSLATANDADAVPAIVRAHSVVRLTQLLLALVAYSSSALYKGECTRHVDASAGVLLLPAAGAPQRLPLPSVEVR